MRNSYGTRHFCNHLENEMLKNQKILKIGPHLGVPICDQSLSNELQSISEKTLPDFYGWSWEKIKQFLKFLYQYLLTERKWNAVNQKNLKIGQRLGVPICNQSFSS